jgi:hypothetical protein
VRLLPMSFRCGVRAVRDPVDLKVEAAVEEVTAVLGLAMRLGAFDKKRVWEHDDQRIISPDERNSEAYFAIALLPGIPEHVRAYLEQLLSNRAKADWDNHGSDRDYFIASAVAELVKRGFRPHRRSRRESACSIVQKALARLGVHMEERNIEHIWRTRDRTRAPFEWPLRLSVSEKVREK